MLTGELDAELDWSQLEVLDVEPQRVPDDLVGEFDVDLLALPMISSEAAGLVDEIEAQLQGDSRLASVGHSLDRTYVFVYWYGDKHPFLAEVLERDDNPVALVVRPSIFYPAALRAAANELVRSGAVAGAGARHDGSGISVFLHEEGELPESPFPLEVWSVGGFMDIGSWSSSAGS